MLSNVEKIQFFFAVAAAVVAATFVILFSGSPRSTQIQESGSVFRCVSMRLSVCCIRAPKNMVHTSTSTNKTLELVCNLFVRRIGSWVD